MLKNTLVLVLILVLTLPGCSLEMKEGKNNYTARDELLGTEILINIKESKEARAACEDIFTRVRQIQVSMTVRKAKSEIAKLNARAGVEEVSLNKDTYHVLQQAVYYSNLTGGAFDPTIGPLVELWGFNSPEPVVPSPQDIQSKLKFVDYKMLEMEKHKDSLTAMLPRDGQAIDLGGIAKGYAGDEAKRILLSHGIKQGIINLGGNVMAVGNKEDGSRWRIGIQNPLAPRGTFMGILQVEDKAVVTSGGYERYFFEEGKRYHHIIDPQTGYPAESGLLSVTIISDQGLLSDALSTGVYVMGLREGMQLVKSLEGVDAIFVTGDKKVLVTEGLQDIFQLTDGDFCYGKY